jgi:arylsulfatase A-like enzyme
MHTFCRIFFLGFLLVIIGTELLCAQSVQKSADRSKPNIIFILTDDQRWDALGFAGNPIIHTPHIDGLASSGIYFRNAFVTTPICAASRASLFTGLYERTHDYNFGKPNLNDQYMFDSYPYLLKQAGYATGFVGKFGVKVNKGIADSMFTYRKETAWPYIKKIDGKEIHLADIEGNYAIDFIKANKNQPFCLSLSFWAPHADDDSKEQYFWPSYTDTMYSKVKIPLPPTSDPAFFDSLPEFMKITMSRQRWYWRFDSTEKYQRMVKGYYKMISGVDSVVGRIRKALKEQGLADNTVIIFMGDNGYFLGDRGYADKWLMYEQSIRVPMLVYDPRLPKSANGKTYQEMVLNVDITPTILQLAGVPVPQRYAGKSLTAFYKGHPAQWRSSVFCEHRIENNPLLLKTECFRDDTWKFIRYEDHPEYIELYNFRKDPYETKNLAYDKKYAAMVSDYTHKCDSIAASLLSKRVAVRK